MAGILELRHIPVPGDTAADEAVWWFRREGKAVVGIAGIDPDGGFLVSRDRFAGRILGREIARLEHGRESHGASFRWSEAMTAP